MIDVPLCSELFSELVVWCGLMGKQVCWMKQPEGE
jgi:hypothetical protein